MKKLFVHITESLKEVFEIFFSSDIDVISQDARKNFSNKDDLEKFANAIKELRRQEKDGESPSASFILHNNKKITLTR